VAVSPPASLDVLFMENFLIKYGLLAVFVESVLEADAIPFFSLAFSQYGYFDYSLGDRFF